jgi:hypothetical protein
MKLIHTYQEMTSDKGRKKLVWAAMPPIMQFRWHKIWIDDALGRAPRC